VGPPRDLITDLCLYIILYEQFFLVVTLFFYFNVCDFPVLPRTKTFLHKINPFKNLLSPDQRVDSGASVFVSERSSGRALDLSACSDTRLEDCKPQENSTAVSKISDLNNMAEEEKRRDHNVSQVGHVMLHL